MSALSALRRGGNSGYSRLSDTHVATVVSSTRRVGTGMSAALAGALATAKAANPGAKTAAAHAREGQATTARSKKWIGAASRRSAQAALEASSRQVEASGGPVCPLTPIGGRTGGRCNNREAFSPLRYWALNFTAEPLAAPRRTASACSTDVGPSSCSSRVDGQRRCWMAGRVMTWTEAGAGGRRERRSGAGPSVDVSFTASCAAPTGRVPGLRGAFIIASTVHRALVVVMVLGTQHSGVLLDCSKSSRQCSLSYLLTYF